MIGISSDHGGFKLKEKLINELKEYNLKDYGTYSDESVNYPEYGFKIGEAIKSGEIEKGIVICTTGIGISIAANKVKGVRCAKVDNLEEARLCREHNDANVLALNSKNKNALDIARIFLDTSFSNEERHINRINMIKEYEDEH